MISTEVALIMTAGMIGGPLLMILVNNLQWFKKENFKFKLQLDRKEANLRFKKLERELGVKDAPIPPREQGISETLQGLDIKKIKDLASMFTKEDDQEYEEYPEEKPDILSTVLDVAEKNPQLASAVAKKIMGVADETTEDTQHPSQM